jgi:exopolyphosphatase / guanosine-5'-triphosphate,3'-diphosphate pyrophosphatase
VRVCVVDLGSNTTRMLLCEGLEEGRPRGERVTEVTGLGRGAGADGALAESALARLVRCLDGFAARVTAFRPERLLAIGTSAVRDAPNRGRVITAAAARLGAPVAVVTGDEEAALSYRGARMVLPPAMRAAVLDIGGASTEIAVGAGEHPDRAFSVDVGALRTGEGHLHDDPPSPASLTRLRREVARRLEPLRAVGAGATVVVGVAGTLTTLAAIHREGRPISGRVPPCLRRADVEAMLARLAAIPERERREIAGLDPARAPVIVAGAAIAAEALAALDAHEIVVSERDLLDAVALDLVFGSGDLLLRGAKIMRRDD